MFIVSPNLHPVLFWRTVSWHAALFFFPTVALCVCVCVFSNSKESDTPRSTVPRLWRCCCGPTLTASLCIVCKQCALRVFVSYLCADHFPVVTVAGVAVVVPLGAVQLGVSVNRAGFPCNCHVRKMKPAVKTFFPSPFYYPAPIVTLFLPYLRGSTGPSCPVGTRSGTR